MGSVDSADSLSQERNVERAGIYGAPHLGMLLKPLGGRGDSAPLTLIPGNSLSVCGKSDPHTAP